MKNLKYLGLVFLFILGLNVVSAVPAWDIDNGYYENKSLASAISPLGNYMSDDGTDFYVLGLTGQTINQYSLSTPGDISTASFVASANVTSEIGTPTGIFLSSNGTYMYVMGVGATDHIYMYSLSTAGDITSKTYIGASPDITEDGTPRDFYIKGDGTKVYVSGSGGSIYQYSLSTPYYTTTLSYDSVSKSVVSEQSNPTSIFMKSDGTRMYVGGQSASEIYSQYDLATPWLLSTATYNGVNLSWAPPQSSNYGISFSANGSYMYATDNTNAVTYQFFIGDVIPAQSISYDNINLTNNTLTNESSLGVGINITATNTNTNINTTMYLSNGSSYQIGTNTQNVSYTLTDIQEGTYNIWFFSENNETNVTSGNYTYIFDFTNPTLTNNIASIITSYTFNPSANISFSDNVGVDYCYFNVSNGQSALCNATSFTFNLNGNLTYNLTLKDEAGNIVNDNNNIVLVNPYQYFYFEDESNNPITDFTLGGTTYEDYANILTYNEGLVLGSNSLSFSKTGYLTQTINFNLNTTSAINNSYTVQNATITITIRYKENSSIITGYNFSLEFIGTVGLVTSTTNGVVNISNTLFQNENYRVVISNEDFFTESIFFDFNNQEQLSVDAYMLELNDSKAGNVIVKVIDFTTQIVEGATVYALQWNSVISKYEAVSQGTTGSDGQSVLNIILDNKVYIFTAEKNGNWANSTSEIISTAQNGKTIAIPLSSTTAPNSYLFQNLLTEIVEIYSNTTNISTVYFSWQNLEGISSNICINVYREIGTVQNRIITNCTSGIAGSYVISNYLNSSHNLYVKAEVKVGNAYITLKSFFRPASASVSAFLSSLNLSIFILPLLVILGICIGLFADNALIGTAFIVIFTGLGLTLAPDLLTTGIVAFVGLIGFLIIKYGRKAI